jgi:hypothetical protein
MKLKKESCYVQHRNSRSGYGALCNMKCAGREDRVDPTCLDIGQAAASGLVTPRCPGKNRRLRALSHMTSDGASLSVGA